MRFRICFIALVISCMALPMHAQLSMPVQTIGNVKYYYHKVKKKETLYGVAKMYGITQEDIVRYNPSAKDGLKNKQTLLFPVDAFNKGTKAVNWQQTTDKKVSAITHTVEKGETLYGLSRLYNTTVDALISANPSAEAGLKVGQVITIPQEESVKISSANANAATAADSIYHRIEAGETLYSVSRSYNTTIASILDLNPGISAENFRTGEVICIVPNQDKSVTVEKKVTRFVAHEIEKGENFSSIARDYNIDVAALIEANPGVKDKKGNVINIPISHNETVTMKESDIASNAEIAKRSSDTINVAIIQAFMLNQSKPSATALNNTEFLKGFLLGVDDVRNSTNKHINISVYDNRNSLAATDSILAIADLKKSHLIIAPSETKQLSAVNKFCQENSILAVNVFAIKDESFATNPFAVQTNIPQSYLSAEVCEWFDKKFSGYTTIFINAAKASEEKDVCTDLKAHLAKNNANTVNAAYGNTFNFDTLNEHIKTGGKYVIMPSSSSRTMIAHLIPILKRIKQERTDASIVLLGYPEYTTYLMTLANDLHAIDTYIYSRFFYDKDNSKTKSFASRYSKWYNEEMRYVVPRFGILGYDNAVFFLKTICRDDDAFNNRELKEYDGLQTSFKLKRTSNWSGFINKDLQFIRFTPHNTIER